MISVDVQRDYLPAKWKQIQLEWMLKFELECCILTTRLSLVGRKVKEQSKFDI